VARGPETAARQLPQPDGARRRPAAPRTVRRRSFPVRGPL